MNGWAVGKKSRIKKFSRGDRQRIEAFAQESKSYTPIAMQDGVQCTDCSAKSLGNKLVHDDSCPAANALDRTMDFDRGWFDDHPGQYVFIRPVTKSEVMEYQLANGKDVKGFYVTVSYIAPGLRRRHLAEMRFISGHDDIDIVYIVEDNAGYPFVSVPGELL